MRSAPRSPRSWPPAASVDEVRQHFVDRYGQWILLQPADPLIWLLPLAVVAIGVAVFAWWLLARRSGEADAGVGDAGGEADAG